MNPATLYWTTIDMPVGVAFLAVSRRGICRLGVSGRSADEYLDELARCYPTAEIGEDPAAAEGVDRELEAYWQGNEKRFSVPLDLKGTSFQRSVWDQLQQIPFGETVTYGQIAEAIGLPGAARAVGRAIGANPVPIIVPCHRVIGSDGSLTGFSAGLDVKRLLLRHEGVTAGNSR